MFLKHLQEENDKSRSLPENKSSHVFEEDIKRAEMTEGPEVFQCFQACWEVDRLHTC